MANFYQNIKKYIKDSSPDILLLQEIKTQVENFPSDVFEKLGYTSYIFGQKSYNGVAIISKHNFSSENDLPTPIIYQHQP